MISLMDSVEATERSASLRTSPATTANPRPASPARAASIAAFSARRLVWAAISLINSRISPICCARSPSDPAWLATPSIWLRRNDMASPVRSAALTAVCMVSARDPAVSANSCAVVRASVATADCCSVTSVIRWAPVRNSDATSVSTADADRSRSASSSRSDSLRSVPARSPAPDTRPSARRTYPTNSTPAMTDRARTPAASGTARPWARLCPARTPAPATAAITAIPAAAARFAALPVARSSLPVAARRPGGAASGAPFEAARRLGGPARTLVSSPRLASMVLKIYPA